MADNDDAGGSGSKPFWTLSQELEEQQAMEVEEEEVEVDKEEREVQEEEMEDVHQDDMYVEGEEMEGADDTTATGKDGTQWKKRPRKDGKDRRPNQLKVDRHGITHVSKSGNPLAPEEFVVGYGLQLGCIL
jgi:hypothetical protein